jgi:hypothetical protein
MPEMTNTDQIAQLLDVDPKAAITFWQETNRLSAERVPTFKLLLLLRALPPQKRKSITPAKLLQPRQAEPAEVPSALRQATTVELASPTGFELWAGFYHMTHYRNLPSILQHGILSWTEVHSRDLAATDISDPSVQRWRARPEPVYRRAIHDYAPLYINPKNAMLYVRRHLQHEIVILKVSETILRRRQHLFTDGNAASKDTVFSADRAIVDPSDEALRAVRWADVPDGKRRRCAEVLVYPSIESDFIICAICSNQNLVNELADPLDLPIVVDPEVFY